MSFVVIRWFFDSIIPYRPKKAALSPEVVITPLMIGMLFRLLILLNPEEEFAGPLERIL